MGGWKLCYQDTETIFYDIRIMKYKKESFVSPPKKLIFIWQLLFPNWQQSCPFQKNSLREWSQFITFSSSSNKTYIILHSYWKRYLSRNFPFLS